jgi:hypothetical protein
MDREGVLSGRRLFEPTLNHIYWQALVLEMSKLAGPIARDLIT